MAILNPASSVESHTNFQAERIPVAVFLEVCILVVRIKYLMGSERKGKLQKNSNGLFPTNPTRHCQFVIAYSRPTTLTNWQCRVGLVGKWPLKWPRRTGSVTFRWQIIVESKIRGKFFFRRGISLSESRAKAVIFGTNVPQLSVFYVAEADCRAISRNVEILAKLATGRGDRRKELPALLNYM